MVYPSCPIYRASGIHLFLFISLSLKHFSIIPCIFQKKSVSLQKKDHLQMRVGSNRRLYLKFMAHVPLFLSAKICESRVLTKNF